MDGWMEEGLAVRPAVSLLAPFSSISHRETGTGTVRYFEWIRVLSKYAEETEAGAKPHNWPPAVAALGVTPVSKKGEEEGVAVVVEGDNDNETAADDAALRRASMALRERGLHAHGLIKQLQPESDGRLDARGLVSLFAKLGVPIDEAMAQRFVTRADLMGTGKVVSWELVRLISAAAPTQEE